MVCCVYVQISLSMSSISCQALQPELYLLPITESDSSVCSQSLTSDTHSCSDHQTCCPSKTCSLTTGTKEPVKLPLIPQCSQQSPPTPSPDEEEEEGEEESYSSTDEEEPLTSHKHDWVEEEPHTRSSHHNRSPLPVTDPKSENERGNAQQHSDICLSKLV